MQYLKALVIGMGILIIIGMVLLAYGLLKKTGSPSAPASETSDLSAGFGELALTGNAGCRIESAVPDGRRLIVELAPVLGGTSAVNCEKIVIIDMTAGSVIGSVALQP